MNIQIQDYILNRNGILDTSSHIDQSITGIWSWACGSVGFQDGKEFEECFGPFEDDRGELIGLLLGREKLDADPEKEAEKQVADHGAQSQAPLDRNILFAGSSDLKLCEALPVECRRIGEVIRLDQALRDKLVNSLIHFDFLVGLLVQFVVSIEELLDLLPVLWSRALRVKSVCASVADDLLLLSSHDQQGKSVCFVAAVDVEDALDHACGTSCSDERGTGSIDTHQLPPVVPVVAYPLNLEFGVEKQIVGKI